MAFQTSSQVHLLPSNPTGRSSFSHNPFRPRRSTSVNSLQQSFQVSAPLSTPTPPLKRLSSKLFHRKPSLSLSSNSTGQITTATSLSPSTSERPLSLAPDSTSPANRQTTNYPQLLSRHSNTSQSEKKSNQSPHSNSLSSLNIRSSCIIGITHLSTKSLTSLSKLGNFSTSSAKNSTHHPLAMDDDPEYYQTLSQPSTPCMKVQHTSPSSTNILQTPITPATPLEKPEFQTEYARQLFRGNGNVGSYTAHDDEDEELAHASSNSDLNFHRGRTISHPSQDALPDQSQPSRFLSRPSLSKCPSTSGLDRAASPAYQTLQTPSYNSTLNSRGAFQPASAFRSSVRRRVDGIKSGLKLLKPSRVPADEANCLTTSEDASRSLGIDGMNPENVIDPSQSHRRLSWSLQPENAINGAPSQVSQTLSKSSARAIPPKSSTHESLHISGLYSHLGGARGSVCSSANNLDTHRKSSQANPDTTPPSENDGSSSRHESTNDHPRFQIHSNGPHRLRPGRVPLKSLDLSSESHNYQATAVPVSKCHQDEASYPKELIGPQKTMANGQHPTDPESTVDAGNHADPPPTSTYLNRRRSPIIHESANDLRRQIAREIHGNETYVAHRAHSDGRSQLSTTPPSAQASMPIAPLQPRNSIRRPVGVHDAQSKVGSNQPSQPHHALYHQPSQQSFQHQNHLSLHNNPSQNQHRYSRSQSSAGFDPEPNPANPPTPSGSSSQSALKFQTPSINPVWASSAVSSTAQPRSRQERRPPPPVVDSFSPNDDDESDEDEDMPCQSPDPPRNALPPVSQRRFYVREDHDAAYSHRQVPLNDENDRQVRKLVEPNRIEKNLIVVNDVEYTRQCVIGRGGSSKVFRAGMADGSSKMVAIKVVGLKQADRQTYLTFCNEIDLLKRLRGHDRIINLIDSSMDDARRKVWLVMELGETDLNQLLNRQMGKPISFRFIKHVWEQMLEAVHAVHEEGIIHTDLKPANFVLVQGSVKLIDFGIAKAIPADTTNISRETQIGTANYMSPEALIMQQSGDHQAVKMGRATDVWALGCILYQMVYGHTPFSKLETSLKVLTIRDPKHVIDYPASVVPVSVTSDGKKILLHEHKIVVEKEAIQTIKACLSYKKEDRPTIPCLLKNDFLLGTSTSSPQSQVNEDGSLTISPGMFDLIVQKSWDWFSRKTANGGRLTESQKRKFLNSLRDSIHSSQ